MALTTGEKRFAIVAVVVVFLVGLFWVGSSVWEKWSLGQKIDSFEAFKQQHAMTYQQGDVIRCNSEEDEALVDDSGWHYYAGFDWSGTMNVTVEDSWLFDDIADGCKALGLKASGKDIDGQGALLLVKVRMENVDASPVAENGYSISYLHGLGEWCYFSDESVERDEKNYLVYQLGQGETETYYIGFGISSYDMQDNPHLLDEPCLYLGTHLDDPEKITVRLAPVDMRAVDAA